MLMWVLSLLALACTDPVDVSEPTKATTTEVDADTDSDADTDTDVQPTNRLLIQHRDFECDPGETLATDLEVSPEALVQAFTRQDNHLGVVWWTDGGLFSIDAETHLVTIECEWVGSEDGGLTDLIVGMRIVWTEEE